MKKEILSSKFFTLGNEPLTKKQLQVYCKLWWPIQPEFTLGLVILLGKIAEKIRYDLSRRDVKSAEVYENIFKWLAPTIIDEMGFGRDPYGLMHHNLFAKQVFDTTGITKRRLVGNPLKVLSNSLLSDEIHRSFSNSIASGICMMFVVETIAPEIFEMQKKIFLAAGAPLEKLQHSSLHENLEKEHANEAEEYNTLLPKIASDATIKNLIDGYGDVWKSFLDDIYQSVISS